MNVVILLYVVNHLLCINKLADDNEINRIYILASVKYFESNESSNNKCHEIMYIPFLESALLHDMYS